MGLKQITVHEQVFQIIFSKTFLSKQETKMLFFFFSLFLHLEKLVLFEAFFVSTLLLSQFN
jgi:hypothetical protein